MKSAIKLSPYDAPHRVVTIPTQDTGQTGTPQQPAAATGGAGPSIWEPPLVTPAAQRQAQYYRDRVQLHGPNADKGEDKDKAAVESSDESFSSDPGEGSYGRDRGGDRTGSHAKRQGDPGLGAFDTPYQQPNFGRGPALEDWNKGERNGDRGDRSRSRLDLRSRSRSPSRFQGHRARPTQGNDLRGGGTRPWDYGGPSLYHQSGHDHGNAAPVHQSHDQLHGQGLRHGRMYSDRSGSRPRPHLTLKPEPGSDSRPRIHNRDRHGGGQAAAAAAAAAHPRPAFLPNLNPGYRASAYSSENVDTPGSGHAPIAWNGKIGSRHRADGGGRGGRMGRLEGVVSRRRTVVSPPRRVVLISSSRRERDGEGDLEAAHKSDSFSSEAEGSEGPGLEEEADLDQGSREWEERRSVAMTVWPSDRPMIFDPSRTRASSFADLIATTLAYTGRGRLPLKVVGLVCYVDRVPGPKGPLYELIRAIAWVQPKCSWTPNFYGKFKKGVVLTPELAQSFAYAVCQCSRQGTYGIFNVGIPSTNTGWTAWGPEGGCGLALCDVVRWPPVAVEGEEDGGDMGEEKGDGPPTPAPTYHVLGLFGPGPASASLVGICDASAAVPDPAAGPWTRLLPKGPLTLEVSAGMIHEQLRIVPRGGLAVGKKECYLYVRASEWDSLHSAKVAELGLRLHPFTLRAIDTVGQVPQCARDLIGACLPALLAQIEDK